MTSSSNYVQYSSGPYPVASTSNYYSNAERSSTSSPSRVSPRSQREMVFDHQHIEVADTSQIDEDVCRQIEHGLIDANDIAGEDMEDLDNVPRQTIRRKVKKMVEVPVTRKVKVPTTTQTVVPDKQLQKIMVKRQVPQTDYKMVEEAYTDIEKVPATRMKELWVKKMVPEQYMKNIEVRKTRQIKVPVETFKEVEEEKLIEIDCTKVVDVPGWRVDEVKDTKMVEIEGWQEVELVPRIKDTNIRIEKTFERQAHCRRVERKMGTNVVEDSDYRLDQVDTDSDSEQAEVTSAGIVVLDGTEHRTRPTKGRRSRSPRYYENTTTTTSYSHSPRSHRFLAEHVPTPPATTEKRSSRSFRPASAGGDSGEFPSPIQLRPASSSPRTTTVAAAATSSSSSTPGSPGDSSKMFGLRMNAQSDGLHITEVADGGFAQESGLCAGETIIAVDGGSVTSIRQWRSALAGKMQGDYLTLVIRNDATEKTRPVAVFLDSFNPSHYC